MTPLKDFSELAAALRGQGGKRRVAVVCPDDGHTREVIRRALDEGIADVTLVNGGESDGWAEDLARLFAGRVSVDGTPDADSAARRAVQLVRSGQADVLMKGRINTDNLLRAVLNKERGLLMQGHVLSHITVASIPAYHKLLLFADAAVIPAPTLEQFEAITGYGVSVCRRLGIQQPRVALIHCTEKVSEKFPHTLSYVRLREEASAGRFGNVLMDGPMDVKTACDAESAAVKGLSSPVAGNADMLVFPDIQAGNTFYKTVSLFACAEMAGMLCGTVRPVVVSSRADTAESKFNSLVLACTQAAAV